MIFKFAVEANVKDQMEKQLKKHLYTSYKVYTDYSKAFGRQAFFEIPVANEKEKKELYLIVREIQAPFIMKSEEETKENILTIKEEVRLVQEDHEIILEVGDKIRVLKEFPLSEKLEVARLRGGVPMYHGTSDLQLKNILKHGLLPQSQVYKSKYMKYAGDSENPDYVSVTTSRNHAMMFANNTVREIGGNPIVLVIRYQYPVYHDPEAGGVLPLYLYHGKIEREDIRAYYDENENKTKV